MVSVRGVGVAVVQVFEHGLPRVGFEGPPPPPTSRLGDLDEDQRRSGKPEQS